MSKSDLNKKNKIAQALVLIVVSVVLLEIILQLVILARGLLAPGLMASRYRYDELSNYTLVSNYLKEKPYYISTTADGTRTTGEPVSGGKNIVVMGGSTTFCSLVADNDSWPFWLEKILRQEGFRINVINFGVPSFHANHHIARYQRDVTPKKPVLSIFFLNVNDAQLFKHADLKGEPRDYATLKSVTGRLRKEPPTWIALVRFGRLVRDKLRSLKTRLFFKKEYHYTMSDAAVNWVPDEGILAHYQRSIKKLTELALAAGSVPVFIIPPHMFRDKKRIEAILKSNEQVLNFPNENARYWMGYLVKWRPMQTALIRNAEGMGARVIDMSDIFEAEVSTDIKKVRKFTDDGVHFNPEGNAIFGKRLAGALINQRLITLP